MTDDNMWSLPLAPIHGIPYYNVLRHSRFKLPWVSGRPIDRDDTADGVNFFGGRSVLAYRLIALMIMIYTTQGYL